MGSYKSNISFITAFKYNHRDCDVINLESEGLWLKYLPLRLGQPDANAGHRENASKLKGMGWE